MLHWNKSQHPVKAVLDTGCSVALIKQQTIERLGIQTETHKNPRTIENFTGEVVKGAVQSYTGIMRLQHRKHFSKETFEVTPMEAAIDIFLPFSWIEQHPPQGAWTNEVVRFNSAECMSKCTQHETGPFSLTWDESIATNPSARVIRYVSAVREEDPLKAVPIEFCQYLGIMGREAADALPENRPYDCKIDLQEESTAPWGPIYPLSEEELRTLREWLTEMEKMGKIKRSTSPAGSPILVVPKPHGQGL